VREGGEYEDQVGFLREEAIAIFGVRRFGGLMSRTQSTMVELGTVAPAFELEDVVSGKAVGRDDAAEDMPGLLVMFLCVHCPYVKHVEAELARIGKDYEGKIGIVAISSNDVDAYPEDSPAEMKKQAERLGFRFPYLYDETQEVARAYEAACTPDLFIFDGEMKLVYRGQLDDSRPRRGDFGNDVPVTGKDLRAALDAVIAGKRPDTNQRFSIGCNIKWKE
jgi:thiol-disulfide isomerase/thioredoxin